MVYNYKSFLIDRVTNVKMSNYFLKNLTVLNRLYDIKTKNNNIYIRNLQILNYICFEFKDTYPMIHVLWNINGLPKPTYIVNNHDRIQYLYYMSNPLFLNNNHVDFTYLHYVNYHRQLVQHLESVLNSNRRFRWNRFLDIRYNRYMFCNYSYDFNDFNHNCILSSTNINEFKRVEIFRYGPHLAYVFHLLAQGMDFLNKDLYLPSLAVKKHLHDISPLYSKYLHRLGFTHFVPNYKLLDPILYMIYSQQFTLSESDERVE